MWLFITNTFKKPRNFLPQIFCFVLFCWNTYISFVTAHREKRKSKLSVLHWLRGSSWLRGRIFQDLLFEIFIMWIFNLKNERERVLLDKGYNGKKMAKIACPVHGVTLQFFFKVGYTKLRFCQLWRSNCKSDKISS